jgi:hypothetical protein
MEADFNTRADELIAASRYVEAQALLEATLTRIPKDWTPKRDKTDSLAVAFWNQEEFLAYTHHKAQHLTKSIMWVGESYSKAWYQLAITHSQQGHFGKALFSINCGLFSED